MAKVSQQDLLTEACDAGDRKKSRITPGSCPKE